jgi:hypothetical protein
MDLETARAIVEREKSAPRRDWDFFPAAPYVDGYENLDTDEKRDEFRRAVLTLVAEGDDSEQSLFGLVLTKLGTDTTTKEALRRLLFANPQNPVFVTLVSECAFPLHPYDDDRIALRRLFINDPGRYWQFADLLPLPGDTDVFEALQRGVRGANKPQAVAAFFEGAARMHRDQDFVEVLRDLPASVLREARVFLSDELKRWIDQILGPTPSSSTT